MFELIASTRADTEAAVMVCIVVECENFARVTYAQTDTDATKCLWVVFSFFLACLDAAKNLY